MKEFMYKPVVAFHPGEFLYERLDELGMSQKEFAVRTNKPEKTIVAVIKGRSSITSEMAVVFEQVLKTPAFMWLNLQREYDEFVARENYKLAMNESIAWAKLFPIKEMVDKGWIAVKDNWNEKTNELLSFFGIANPKSWQDYFLNHKLNLAFRISLNHTKNPYAISAWLRKGEIQVAQIETQPYSEEKLKSRLPLLKQLMKEQPGDFFQKIQALCLEAGVKVVFTPALRNAPINGATRWIGDRPIVQMSCRYKKNDRFWFSFFHEIGHIILHGKKEIFLDGYSENQEKEKEADKFAVNWTFSIDEENELLKKNPLTEDTILKFAEKCNTHPAMIIGRLQHKKMIPYYIGQKFIVSIDLEKQPLFFV